MKTARTNKCVSLSDLLAIRESHRQAGRTVVWTNGCFDLLHAGHIRSLDAASRLGDVFVVGVNSDDSVRQLKGEGRPILPALERVEVLSALECIDYIVVFAELTPTETLALVKPDVHCKGSEYAPPHGRPVPERAVVEMNGGRVVFLPVLPGSSTTDLIKRVQRLETMP